MSQDLPSLSELEGRIGISFTDRDLLRRALSHRSWCAEHDVAASNERLEFLGDAVLGMIVTAYAFRSFDELDEGSLSEVRARVVNAQTLASVAAEIGLGEYLLLGRGEDAAGGRAKQSILADALEAVIAAAYVDGGLDVVERLVIDLLEERIVAAATGPGGRDSKTRLQELAARAGLGRPRYEVVGEGPDHAKRFHATVYLGGTALGSGHGRSKKQAEQAAALSARGRLEAASEATMQGDGDAGAA